MFRRSLLCYRRVYQNFQHMMIKDRRMRHPPSPKPIMTPKTAAFVGPRRVIASMRTTWLTVDHRQQVFPSSALLSNGYIWDMSGLNFLIDDVMKKMRDNNNQQPSVQWHPLSEIIKRAVVANNSNNNNNVNILKLCDRIVPFLQEDLRTCVAATSTQEGGGGGIYVRLRSKKERQDLAEMILTVMPKKAGFPSVVSVVTQLNAVFGPDSSDGLTWTERNVRQCIASYLEKELKVSSDANVEWAPLSQRCHLLPQYCDAVVVHRKLSALLPNVGDRCTLSAAVEYMNEGNKEPEQTNIIVTTLSDVVYCTRSFPSAFYLESDRGVQHLDDITKAGDEVVIVHGPLSAHDMLSRLLSKPDVGPVTSSPAAFAHDRPHILYTDASEANWGVVHVSPDGHHRVIGSPWTTTWKKRVIAHKELKALFHGVMYVLGSIGCGQHSDRGGHHEDEGDVGTMTHIIALCDNRNVVMAWNDVEESGEDDETAAQLSALKEMCVKMNVNLDVVWISGRENLADVPSRLSSSIRF
eukprot:PhM_4_TR1272/c0_g1_i1/m.87270